MGEGWSARPSAFRDTDSVLYCAGVEGIDGDVAGGNGELVSTGNGYDDGIAACCEEVGDDFGELSIVVLLSPSMLDSAGTKIGWSSVA